MITAHVLKTVINNLFDQWATRPDLGRYSYGPMRLEVSDDGSFTIKYDATMGLGPLAD